ncbi:maturation of the outermost layer of the spore [Bacillus methanolicus PB1]|uniref:Maturation of the outermost layer of the spore n=1 Tax=Bacillus methanolicus PB1 TaxID=997296 RepID=I3E499_BACMT|nr:glycosyltransferase [Bacillus methanolicus]EIJ81320.1 maturation of the outermost layer of the spore [Bacillus methanolicus PB1]
MIPIVSVILTSYNKPKTIGNAIESVLNQTFGNWELFIMDDHSQKETVEIIKRYINDPRIHYFNSYIQDSERYKTTRYATLINEAIPKTKGKYITYLTDDNIFLPERLETMARVLNQNPDIEIVYSQQLVKTIDENGKVEREKIRKTYGVLKNPIGLVDHCSIMHTRSIADKIYKEYGSYWEDDPAYWFNGDAAFWTRLTNFKPFYPIPKTLDIALKDAQSFQRLYHHLPKNIPNGTLVRSPSSDTYIIDNQERRKIDPEVFGKLKYDVDKIVTIPDPFLFKYKEGVSVDNQVFFDYSLFPDQRLIISPNNPAVFYFQNGKKHHVKNEKAFSDFKFQWDKIVIVSDNLLNQIPSGNFIEELSMNITFLPDGVLFNCDNNFYISLNNHLHPIEKRVATKLNLPVANPVRINRNIVAKFKQGEPFKWQIPFIN